MGKRTIGDLLQLAVDTIAPIGTELRHKIVSRDRRWFEPCIVDGKVFDPGQWVGDFSPYFTRDDLHWFLPGQVVAGPYCPFNILPGERVAVYPATLEEFAQQRVRGIVFIRVCEMARAGVIKPLNHGLYPLAWDDGWGMKDIDQFELTEEDFQRVCTAIPIPLQESGTVAENAATEPAIPASMVAPSMPMTKQAMIEKYQSIWPTIANDIPYASENGLAVARPEGRRGWIEGKALEWARSKGKLRQAPGEKVTSIYSALTNLPRRQHKLKK